MTDIALTTFLSSGLSAGKKGWLRKLKGFRAKKELTESQQGGFKGVTSIFDTVM